MKKILIIHALIIGFISVFAFSGSENSVGYSASADKDYLECFKKYASAWGETCQDCKTFKDSYKVKLRNECLENIDVQVCVQEANKTWKLFKFNKVAPKDSVIAYACEGTGKYLKWVRRSGDGSVNFPTLDEVNAKNKE